MMETNDKLVKLAHDIRSGRTMKIAIMGLGSVGNFLLDYLLSWDVPNIEIHVCGRNAERISADINIARVGNGIRSNRFKPVYFHQIDLEHIDSIETFLREVEPNFLVNTSRVYSGLKYGSISWKNVRAYGIWTPLSVQYIRNIMMAVQRSKSNTVVINTSYSDGANPWLKCSGLPAPDFGSGNLNHLIPRLKLAVADILGIPDPARVLVVLATSHFHDVVISKEGQDEGVAPLVHIQVDGKDVSLDMKEVYRKCAIAMPVDAKRNIMNASSNFEIIRKIFDAIKQEKRELIHSPGVMGNLGGYPVFIDFSKEVDSKKHIRFVEEWFSYEEMVQANKDSIALDGIEDIADGSLVYTDNLCAAVDKAFGVELPKKVTLDDSMDVAEYLIDSIIKPQLDG